MISNVDRGATRKGAIGAMRHQVSVTLSLVVVILASVFGLALAESSPNDILVTVNGDAITAKDVDGMIMMEHKSANMSGETSGIVDRLLKKRINDILIIQDALAAGMDEEPQIQALAADRREKYAIEAFVLENLELPDPPQDSIQAFFEYYYWQIQVRRISVRTREEAVELRSMVMAGADMDSLARALSLDTKKLTGGLYNLLYWADVENRIRGQVRYLEVGEMSDVFPYNEAFSFVRVEQRLGVDESAFARFEKSIRGRVKAKYNQELWERFVEELAKTMKIQESMAALAGILADSTIVLSGEFRREDPAPAIWIEGGPVATSGKLRETVSHEFMQNATAPFGANFATARRKVTARLVLSHAARMAGYFETPAIERRVNADLEQALIELYLNDTVGSRIKFKRSEFDEFYEANKEKFRGPEQVKLDILILEDEDEAKEAAQRLADGADFAFIFKEYRPGQEVTLGQSRYISSEQLSPPYREQLAHMKVGESSQPMKMSMGWVIFKLAGKRQGELPPMESVEIEIRRVIYQQKFNTYLDEHLGLLKEQSEIVEYPDRIEAYILSGEEEG